VDAGDPINYIASASAARPLLLLHPAHRRIEGGFRAALVAQITFDSSAFGTAHQGGAGRRQ